METFMRPDTGFGKRLRKMREDSGLTLAQLAQMSGLHPQTLVKFERGEREPQWSSVIALARALGVGPEEFLPPEPPPEPPRRRKK
jgi:transcriptional regulator with XRE-family HTH domain